MPSSDIPPQNTMFVSGENPAEYQNMISDVLLNNFFGICPFRT